MKILIVDDDEAARGALARLLRSVGTIVPAADGEEAWDLLQGGLRAAICCCDVGMPRLDGIGLLRRVRAHPVLNELPFVLVSVAADRATVDSASAAGADGYLLKPFLAVQTRCTVERLLRQRRATQAEHFLVTRRRLDATLAGLERMLEQLQRDAFDCIQTLEAGAAPQPAAAADLRRLHGAMLHLGLWRGAELLREGLQPDTSGQARLLAVRECGHLVGDQLRSLRWLEGSYPPPALF